MKSRKTEVKNLINDKLVKYFATTPQKATKEQMYKALALMLRDELLHKKQDFNKEVIEKKAKKVYYLCMEFLIGRNLHNALYNLGCEDEVKKYLAEFDIDIEDLYEIEKDPGLGNGGLGRLAACFMDSLASTSYPAMGFSIRYDFGLFKQKIVENQQVELPDLWLDTGDVWMMPRSDKTFRIKLRGWINESWDNGKNKIEHIKCDEIEASAYDLMISGKDSKAISVLRLWKASAIHDFDMKSFTQGDYMNAMRGDNNAEIISKVLYPADDHENGKELRLSQQYLLVSASLQSIIKDHLKVYPNLDNLKDKVAIHINDTHPALAIPELMRLMMDEYGYDWDFAWNTVKEVMAYTNHTVLVEALESWDEVLVSTLLPRIHMILKELNNRFCATVHDNNVDANVDNMKIIHAGRVKMANLSVIGSHSVNGVSELHSDIIKDTIFKDFHKVTPEKFTNVTNGIAYRRWLCQTNPNLTNFLKEVIGDEFITDASALSGLRKFEKDKTVLKKLGDIKLANKVDFSNYLNKISGVSIDPNSRFDVQVKRLHEYKRQLLNVMRIIHYYLDLCDNPAKKVTPQTFIFGAKAAGGYFHAKRIIQLINCIQTEIAQKPSIKEKLNVIFIENYNVSKAEHIFPASEVSEQISLAGKEASGTGNMKFMINGAVTLGTIDGANVEIMQNVGNDNIFTFGMTADEVEKVWHEGYYSSNYYQANSDIRRIVEALKTGFAGESFADIAEYLIICSRNVADPYMVLGDFGDYMRVAQNLDEAYKKPALWNKMSLVNIAQAGVFSSDRSIHEYAKNIWGLKQV